MKKENVELIDDERVANDVCGEALFFCANTRFSSVPTNFTEKNQGFYQISLSPS